MQDAKEIEDYEKKIKREKNNIKHAEHDKEKINSVTPKNAEVEGVDRDEESFEAVNDDDSEECLSDDIMSNDFNEGLLEDDALPTEQVIKLKDRTESLQH